MNKLYTIIDNIIIALFLGLVVFIAISFFFI